MLTFEKELVKIAHVKHRIEKHGDEDVPAVDIKIVYRTTNDVLAHFSSTLKSSLYYLDESVQGDIIRDPSHLPNIKNPKLEPLKWKDKHEHVDFRFHQGVREADDIVFADAKVSKFVIHPMEGGSTTIEFLLQSLLGDNSMDALIHIEKTEVHASLNEGEEQAGLLID
jgi:hypothetical protein